MNSRGDLKISVRSYRNLRGIEFAPIGLCALTGPSGSGKTSLVNALLQAAKIASTAEASWLGIEEQRLDISIESPSWSWSAKRNRDSRNEIVERVKVNDRDLHFSHGSMGSTDGKLQAIWDDAVRDVLQQVADISSVEVGMPTMAIKELSMEGRNIRSLGETLWYWQLFRHLHRHRWVIESIKRLFPDVCYLDVLRDNEVLVIRANGKVVSSLRCEPSSFVRVLEILVEVSRKNRGDTVIIEEIERHLDPNRLYRLLQILLEKADADDLNILLETQSGRVINFFQDDLDSVFLMQEGSLSVLSDVLDPTIASTFRAGDAYGSCFGKAFGEKQ